MLEISLLGEISIHLDGEPITRFRSQKEIALLAYLSHTGQTHNREALADLLWDASSTKQSLSNLRTTLSRLRKQVGDHLIVTRKTVAVTPAVHEQTDTARFMDLMAGSGSARSVPGIELAQGLALYRGEFMADFSLANTPRFNDWLLVEQEHLRQIAMGGYRQLAGLQEEQGAFSEGVRTAQQWVNWDPLDETAQQQLMRLLVKDGRVTESLAVYDKCRLLLQRELGISPALTTTALYRAVQDGSLAPPDITPAPLHNIPRALTPLVGRKEEINQLTSYLANPDYPLISIIGAGGMGKTSLALAVGRQLLLEEKHPFKDGIWFISLEDIENDRPELIREEVATLVGQTMGTYFRGESDLWSQLLTQLAQKKLLLILDNIEQFLTVATELIFDLLQAGEDIHLLATSRTTLALAASAAFPLAGLETPQVLSPDAMNNESVRLFAERAARMPIDFQLEKHLMEVVAICQLVEGMPLGIELAAASLGRLMIDEIVPSLISSVHLFKTNQPDLPPRQRTLQAVFEYSWQLLDAREQAALAQISVFRGGFTRQAAVAVLTDTASGLYNLQHHALLSRDESGRFRMHPLLRQLAREKLNAPQRIELADHTIHRHSLYFSDLMESHADELQRGTGREALQTILPELANLRTAWDYAVHSGQWGIVAASLEGSHHFFQRKGLFNEEAALIEKAIDNIPEAMDGDKLDLAGLLSRLLSIRARDYLRAAQFEEGLKTAERACELAATLQDPGLEGQARLVWAQIHSTQNKREPALAQFEQVVDLAKTAQNQILEADGWNGIGEQMLWIRDLKSVQESLQTALDLCQKLQYRPGEMQTVKLLGDLALRQGASALSVDYFQQTLRIGQLLGDVIAEANALGSLGVALTSQGDIASSQNSHEKALAIFRRLNMPESEQWILGQLGYTTIQLGDYAKAEQLLAEALAKATKTNDQFWQGWVKLRLGALYHERGEIDQALSFINEAYQTSEQFQYLNFQAAVLTDWGNVLISQAEWSNAAEKFQKAYDYRQGAGRIEQATPSLAGLAYATFQQGFLETAAAHVEQLWQSWQESPLWAERADLKLYWMLGMVWQGLDDSRAQDLWRKAYVLLQNRCEQIPDERARKMFLEQVPAHRAVLSVMQYNEVRNGSP